MRHTTMASRARLMIRALGDDMIAVAIGKRERGARRGVPGHRCVIGHEPLAEVAGQTQRQSRDRPQQGVPGLQPLRRDRSVVRFV